MVAEDVSVPNLKSPDLTFRDVEGRLTTWCFVYTKEVVFEKHLRLYHKKIYPQFVYVQYALYEPMSI